jgi:hypothetical protein
MGHLPGRGMSVRYPRVCRGNAGPHTIAGPADETARGQCRVCVLAAEARYRASTKGRAAAARARTSDAYVAARVRSVESGRHAEAQARYRRRRAETRPLPGDESGAATTPG